MASVMKTIKRSDIKDCPTEAQYAGFNPSETFIELFYRIKPIQYNDGTTKDSIQFLSSFDVWQPSMLENTDTLHKIID